MTDAKLFAALRSRDLGAVSEIIHREPSMYVTHKLLDTGYHHVRAVGYAHLFAQWPVGHSLRSENIGYNGDVDVQMLLEFMSAAQAAADTAESEIREQRESDLRARLSLEQRDEPREPYESNIEPNTGLRRHGEI